MVGKSTVGSAEIGKSLYASAPNKITPAIINDVATGLRMNGSEMLTAYLLSRIAGQAVSYAASSALAVPGQLLAQHATRAATCIDHRRPLARLVSIPRPRSRRLLRSIRLCSVAFQQSCRAQSRKHTFPAVPAGLRLRESRLHSSAWSKSVG